MVTKFVYLFSYALFLNYIDKSKNAIKIENAWNNDETVTSYKLFVYFSMYVHFRASPWCEREALQPVAESKKEKRMNGIIFLGFYS